jgi:hypothetical protein
MSTEMHEAEIVRGDPGDFRRCWGNIYEGRLLCQIARSAGQYPIVPIVVMVTATADIMIPGVPGVMEEGTTADTTEVLMGPDTTMDITMDTMVQVAIILRPTINMAGWIADIQKDMLLDPRRLLVAPRDPQLAIPGTEAVPHQQDQQLPNALIQA